MRCALNCPRTMPQMRCTLYLSLSTTHGRTHSCSTLRVKYADSNKHDIQMLMSMKHPSAPGLPCILWNRCTLGCRGYLQKLHCIDAYQMVDSIPCRCGGWQGRSPKHSMLRATAMLHLGRSIQISCRFPSYNNVSCGRTSANLAPIFTQNIWSTPATVHEHCCTLY